MLFYFWAITLGRAEQTTITSAYRNIDSLLLDWKHWLLDLDDLDEAEIKMEFVVLKEGVNPEDVRKIFMVELFLGDVWTRRYFTSMKDITTWLAEMGLDDTASEEMSITTLNVEHN